MAVTGLWPITGGSVQVDGIQVDGPLKIVCMAFQNSTLLPWRNALENVLLPLEIVEPYCSRFRSHHQEYEEMAHELLRTVGLDGFPQIHVSSSRSRPRWAAAERSVKYGTDDRGSGTLAPTMMSSGRAGRLASAGTGPWN